MQMFSYSAWRLGSSGVRFAHFHHRLRGGPPAIKRGCLGLQNLNLQTIANDRYWLRYTAICRSFA